MKPSELIAALHATTNPVFAVGAYYRSVPPCQCPLVALSGVRLNDVSPFTIGRRLNIPGSIVRNIMPLFDIFVQRWQTGIEVASRDMALIAFQGAVELLATPNDEWRGYG